MSESFKTPPVPTTFSHQEGNWNTGYIISRNTDYSQFVWIPVGYLPPTGLWRGKKQSFGVRNYGYSATGGIRSGKEISVQEQSVAKYGGFYLSRYCLTVDSNRIVHSLPDCLPVTYINRSDAADMAKELVCQPDATSHLPYAAELDCALAWLIECGELTPDDIKNAAARRDSRTHTDNVLPTGSNPSLYRRGIYDLAGTVDEWTQDFPDNAFLWGCQPCAWPASSRCYYAPYACYAYTGLRAALLLA